MIDIPGIIANDEKLYEGSLVHYFQVVLRYGRNLNNPYHNFRHLFHVLWQCYDACRYYRAQLEPAQMRVLLIAALLHDFDHTGHGGLGDDDLEIERALRGLRRHIATEDLNNLPRIEALMRSTEYPHKKRAEDLDLSEQILRDADLSQSLDNVWLQQTIFGLGNELNIEPEAMLHMQPEFLDKLSFTTEWGKEKFQKLIAPRKAEALRLLHLLEN